MNMYYCKSHFQDFHPYVLFHLGRCSNDFCEIGLGGGGRGGGGILTHLVEQSFDKNLILFVL